MKFQISTYSHFIFHSDSPGIIEARPFIDGLTAFQFPLLKGGCKADLPDKQAYSGPVPINKKKLDDVKKILQYIPDEQKPFYNSICQWPAKDGQDKDD